MPRPLPESARGRPCIGSLKSHCCLALLAVLVLFSGCAQKPGGPEPRPQPSETETRAPDRPAGEPPYANCAWRKEKGIAQVVGLEAGEASFRFYPGGITIRTRAKPGVKTGQEFRAILHHPLNGPCRSPGLTILEPLPGGIPADPDI